MAKPPLGRLAAGGRKGCTPVAEAYSCPVCGGNRTHFHILYKMAREIRKDAATGEILFAAPDLEVVTRGNQPDIEVRCASCGYTGAEGMFVQAARRDPDPRI